MIEIPKVPLFQVAAYLKPRSGNQLENHALDHLLVMLGETVLKRFHPRNHDRPWLVWLNRLWPKWPRVQTQLSHDITIAAMMAAEKKLRASLS